MKKWWAPAFTIVELIIIVVVIAVLATIVTFAFRTIQNEARVSAAQSDLTRLAAEMQKLYQNDGTYPSTVPSSVTASPDISLSVIRTGVTTVYSGLNAVQNGVLFAQICTDLINEGVGKGVDQSGTTNDYVSGCGNWNDDSTQITGWSTQRWDTPLHKESLLNYAATYTINGAFHKQAQETAVKNFYTQIVSRMETQGGTFPITSFWDYWAAPGNGGVPEQSIAENGKRHAFYCAQATTNYGEDVWRIDENAQVKQGSC